MKGAFSMVELLVALGILALAALVVVPRFLSVRSQAQDAVAGQIQSQLNHIYAEWSSGGGQHGSQAATSDLLYVLTTSGLLTVGAPGSDGYITETNMVSQIKASRPAGLENWTAPISPAQQDVAAGDYNIRFDNDTRQFAVTRAGDTSGTPVPAPTPEVVWEGVSEDRTVTGIWTGTPTVGCVFTYGMDELVFLSFSPPRTFPSGSFLVPNEWLYGDCTVNVSGTIRYNVNGTVVAQSASGSVSGTLYAQWLPPAGVVWYPRSGDIDSLTLTVSWQQPSLVQNGVKTPVPEVDSTWNIQYQ